MASTDKVKLVSKARKLGIENYRSMSVDELEAAISAAGTNGSDAAPAKAVAKAVRKPAVKKAAPAKAVAATKAPVKKAAKTSPVAAAPAKSTPRKPVAGKKAPAKSKSAEAKPAAKGAKAKRPVSETKEANGVFVNKVRRGKYSPRETYNITAENSIRNFIDASAVDWTADWSAGKTGTRGEVLKAVRKYKGNNNKIFAALADRAQELFDKNRNTGKKYTKEEALRTLRWFISRVKFDFLVATGQHSPSKKHSNRIKTGREAKGSGTKASKAAPAKKKAKATSTLTRKPKAAQKGSKAPAEGAKRRGRPVNPNSARQKALRAAAKKK